MINLERYYKKLDSHITLEVPDRERVQALGEEIVRLALLRHGGYKTPPKNIQLMVDFEPVDFTTVIGYVRDEEEARIGAGILQGVEKIEERLLGKLDEIFTTADADLDEWEGELREIRDGEIPSLEGLIACAKSVVEKKLKRGIAEAAVILRIP